MTRLRIQPAPGRVLGLALCIGLVSPAHAVWNSADGTLEVRGFLENQTNYRDDVGLTKQRLQAQVELFKHLQPRGIFSELSVGGTLRLSYDGVYDLNDKDYGRNAGGPVNFSAPGNPALFGILATGDPNTPPFPPSTTPSYAGVFSPFTDGAIPLPGVPGGTINSPGNPNDGLRFAAADIYSYQDQGVTLATPVRPCDKDNRGCLSGYMDKRSDELRFKEINDDLDFIRELYVNATIPVGEGDNELAFRIGRQQVVWGRTDLFRVLDIVNPMDFSRENLYAEFEDSRIPQVMVNMEYRIGATKVFDDLNYQLLYKVENFRPHDLGQGGEPYAILGAGNLFRALANCWDNGCTVGNFPAAGFTVDFPANAIGIRQVNEPDHSEFGGRIEGVFRGVGFSLNAMYFYSQFPSLRGGIPTDDPFTPAIESVPHDYDIAFDVDFPRLFMVGGSADWYSEKLKSSFRFETSYTTGEEFADTSKPRLFSDSDVFRAVVGFDRPTFIPFLNKTRAFLISGQVFYQRLMDYETYSVNSIGIPIPPDDPANNTYFDKIGFQDWEDNILLTLLIQGNYLNDRLTPQIITAYDTEAEAGVISPSIEFKPANNWVFKLALNLKWANDSGGAIPADDNRSANPFPAAAVPTTPGEAGSCPLPVFQAAPGACTVAFSSLGMQGFEPLGRFRSGPIGTAVNEDEIQFTLRYQF